MPGDFPSPELSPVYVRARHVLLDALEALAGQRQAIILVGAQAIYLHTGQGELAIAPFTADADLAIDPARLTPTPELEQAMRGAGFMPADQPGIWQSGNQGVPVDLLVPEALGGGRGRRSAELPGHGAKVARKVRGLEAALIDHQPRTITALDPSDTRAIEVAVAGPAALLVAKMEKIAERVTTPQRQKPKDAYDAYLLLQAIPTEQLAERLTVLSNDPLASAVTASALTALKELFSTEQSAGTQQVIQAVGPLEDPAQIAESSVALAKDLLLALQKNT